MKTQHHFATPRPRKNSFRQASNTMPFETWPQTIKPLMKHSSSLPAQKREGDQSFELGYN